MGVSYEFNAYAGSCLEESVRKKASISFLDLDGTFAAGSIKDRMYVREFIDARSVYVAMSARTPEMVMSSGVRCNSRMRGEFMRDIPLLKSNGGRYWYEPPEKIDSLKGLLNPAAILSFVVGNYVRHSSGQNGEYYRRDLVYDMVLGGNTWKEEVFNFLRTGPEEDILEYLAPIEHRENYERGITDVEPLPYRIQFHFEGDEGLKRMSKFLYWFLPLRFCQGFEDRKRFRTYKFARMLEVVNESRPDEGKYVLYIVPVMGTKARAVNQLLSNIKHLIGMRAYKKTNILIAGDTLTDIPAAYYAGYGNRSTTFLLVGGSRLTEYLVGRKRGREFAGTDIKWASDRLVETSRRGVYIFKVTGSYTEPRRFIVGDLAFPNTRGAATIRAYCESDLYL